MFRKKATNGGMKHRAYISLTASKRDKPACCLSLRVIPEMRGRTLDEYSALCKDNIEFHYFARSLTNDS